MDEVLKPVKVFTALAALDGAKTKIRFLQFVVILIIVVCSVITRQIIRSVHDTAGFVIQTVESVCYNIRIPVTFCCLIMARKNANQIGDFVSTAQMIDKKFKNMGFAVDYSTGRRQTQIFAGVLIFKIVLQLMPFYFLGTSWSLVDFLDFIVYNLPAFVVYVCSIQWITHIAIIRLQFKTLNKILKILRYQPPWFVETYRLRKKKSISSKILIRECGTFYDALCIQSGKINNAFAVQVLLIISMLLMLIIFDSFQTCRMIQNLTEFDCGSVVYNILYFETLMELVLPCVLIESEADRFSDNLHKINNNEIEDVVHLLILQSCYQRIEFSICGIFTLSGKFIYSIFGAMTTFLIMLLQFEL